MTSLAGRPKLPEYAIGEGTAVAPFNSRMPHMHTLCCAHRLCVSAQVSNSSCRQTSLGINDLETLLYSGVRHSTEGRQSPKSRVL